MTKRVLCLRGSPRANGNSDRLADTFCQAAQVAGASVEDFALRDIPFVPFGDEADGEPDALSPVLERIYQTDVLVLSPPIYFCNITGLLKGAIDRFFCFLKPDYLTAAHPSKLPEGKAVVLLQTQGEPEARYGDLLDQYGPGLDKLGFSERHLLRACEVRDRGDIQQQPEILRSAETLARRILGETHYGT